MPGPLVPEHQRSRALPVAVADVEVRVADARRHHPDADLAVPRFVQRQLLDPERLPRPLDDRRAHGARHAASVRRGEPYRQPPVTVTVPLIP
jgi:hypothetical protein